MKLSLITVLSTIIFGNLVLGAPAPEDSCRPVGKPGPIVGLGDFRDESVQNFKFGKTNAYKGDVLIPSEEPGQIFQFYECDLPSDKFKHDLDDEEEYHGQPRLRDDPSLCVTPGYVNVRVSEGGHNHHEPYPKDGEKNVRLEPCASKPSLMTRKQWFSMRKNVNKGCSRVLNQMGWARDAHDMRAPCLLYDQHDEHNEAVSLGITNRFYARILMLGSGKSKHSCIAYPEYFQDINTSI